MRICAGDIRDRDPGSIDIYDSKGGGKPLGIAQGGGTEPGKLSEALAAARKLAGEKLE